MCEQTVRACPSLLNFVPDWFVGRKNMESLNNAAF